MKKVFLVIIIFVMIILMGVSVYAEYAEPLPGQPTDMPCMFISKNEHAWGNIYVLYYSDIPVRLENYRQLVTGKWGWDVIHPQGQRLRKYLYDGVEWKYQGAFNYSEDTNGGFTEYVVYTNYSIGQTIVDLEVAEENYSFFGIDFEYSNFFGDMRVQLGKKKQDSTYKILKEWQYPSGAGHVSIPAEEMPQENKGEYIIIIKEGDTIVGQYPYRLDVQEGPYCEINYPVNGQSYTYYPNVNIRYFDMGKLYIYINGEMYKQIQTKDKEGIEVIEGKNDLFDIGMNTVSVKDSNGQVVATVQYEVLREGLDVDYELPEFEAESWVGELFNRIMNEYSLFFEYVKSMYAFLPVEIIGLVGIIMMLSVILWFTGRK